MKKAAKKIVDAVTGERFTKSYAAGMMFCYGMAFVCVDAAAAGATAKEAAINVFNILYSLLGASSGIAIVVQVLNMKLGNLLSIQDPRKKLVETMIYAVIGFAVVGLIQLAKSFAAGSGSDIGSI